MSNQIRRINVGGTLYTTSKSTLDKFPGSILSRIADDDNLDTSIAKLEDGSYFIDRDGTMFAHILNYLRTEKLCLPEEFRDMARLRNEAEYYQLDHLNELLCQPSVTLDNQVGAMKLSKSTATNGASHHINGESGGYVTLGYRGTFAFGRDGQADVKFRKLHRILVCGRITLCREIFGDTLNESRDPGGPDDEERYTSRLYLKHQCLERACDLMAERGFILVATCCSGANGLAAANHPVISSQSNAPSQSDLMNHRNCGDYEEQRWAHYTEYLFYRSPATPGRTPTPSPRDL